MYVKCHNSAARKRTWRHGRAEVQRNGIEEVGWKKRVNPVWIRRLSCRRRAWNAEDLAEPKAELKTKVNQPLHPEDGLHAQDGALLIQVEHPSVLEYERSWWEILRDECPPQAWSTTAVLLACLESLYRVEYSQIAEAAIAALNTANSAPVPTTTLEANNDTQQENSGYPREGKQTKDDAASAASAAVKAAIMAVTTAAANSGDDATTEQPSAEDQLLAAAQQADAELAAWVMHLAARSQFQAFSRRDAELGKTLNQGYLDQLFIKSNARRLDRSLLQAFVPSMETGNVDRQFVEESGVVVLKRGFCSEKATGRLVLQKLDYLQTAVVEKALQSGRSRMAVRWQQLLSSSQRSLDNATESLAKESSEQALSISLLEQAARAGSRAVAWLSERGVAPIVDSLSLADINRAFPVREPSRLPPLQLRVVGLKEVLGAESTFQKGPKGVLELLRQPLELEEPTLKEIAVIYRRARRQDQKRLLGRAKDLLDAVMQRMGLLEPAQTTPGSTPRQPIGLQIYRDIPLPTWSVVLPEKVLQFRPLDFLRTDLFAISGLIAALAQARYDSFYLQVVTAVSASIFLIRIVLGFRRMEDRYRVKLSEILREKTVATDATALQYMAASACDQQFQQAALCYILLMQQQEAEGITGSKQDSTVPGAHEGLQAGEAGTLDGLAARAEQLLERRGMKVCFDVDQAIEELLKRGLARKRNNTHMRQEAGQGGGLGLDQCAYDAVAPQDAQQLIEDEWSGVLWTRVQSTLKRMDALLGER